MTDDVIKGYDLDEIDDVAKDIFELLVDQGVTVDLSVLALCRAITIIAEDEQLDHACRMIDMLSEIPYDYPEDDEEVVWGDEDDMGDDNVE